MIEGFFGEGFDIDITKPQVKNLVKKVNTIVEKQLTKADSDKLLKSKKLSIAERRAIIKDKVIKTLRKQKDNVVTIRSLDDFKSYIDKAIERGVIAIDTETNNSLDPVTCDLMGLCLYVPGEKQVYIPINHIDIDTKQLLPDQLTVKDVHDQLARLMQFQIPGNFTWDFEGQSYMNWFFTHIDINNIQPHQAPRPLIVMHNAKFDEEVILETCDLPIEADIDTQVVWRLLNENEKAALKYLYTTYIDSNQAKYDIEGLFEHLFYGYFEPEIFALYAATDAMMTYKVLLMELQILLREDYAGVFWLLDNIEMPIVHVTKRMELRGVTVDQALGERLKVKYTNQLTDIDNQINDELAKLKPKIDVWRESEFANTPVRIYYKKPKGKKAKKKNVPDAILDEQYPYKDDEGNRYKFGKTPSQQLSDPIKLSSPVQLAILFYDILKAPKVSKKSPRGTGEEELQKINEKLKLPLCDLILKRRGIVKLITTYIDTIPVLVKHWPDGRIRFHLNSLGTDTGRYSSGGKIKYLDENLESVEVSGINIQNIPSHNKEIRLLFKAAEKHDKVEINNSTIIVDEYVELETNDGYKYPKDLLSGHYLVTNLGNAIISSLTYSNKKYTIVLEGAKMCTSVKTRTRYKIVGSDYSAQEPRLTAFMSQDPAMMKAYEEGRDLYAVIAQSAFNNNYEDNLEFYPEGTEIELDGKKIICGHKTHLNKAGKERRSVGKVLLLAILYGMSAKTAGERLGKTKEEAQELMDNFFKGFVKVKELIEDSKKMLIANGYVVDWAGRRRRLDDFKKPPYEAYYKDEAKVDELTFNPIIDCEDRKLMDQKLKWYLDRAKSTTNNKQFEELEKEADKEGIELIANTGRIAQAERQCLNARIQGGAASLTKLAMVNIDKSQELKDLKAYLIITVHDEVLVECPEFYSEQVEVILPKIMVDTAKPFINVPMKCDPYNVYRWYADEAAVAVREEFKKYEEGNPKKNIPPMSREDAIKKLIDNHTELPVQTIMDCIEKGCDLEFD